MLREFLHKNKGGGGVHHHHHNQYSFSEDGRLDVSEQPELSLGPSCPSSFISSDADGKFSRKQRSIWEESPPSQSSIELQLQAPLPPDWEQCLDLQSGRMYYVNRRTLKKSWEWPREPQKLDLELNISTTPTATTAGHHSGGNSSKAGKMVAVPCLRCHLLVMLSTSSPSCPNCKFVHSFADLQRAPSPRRRSNKPPETLSLLH